SAILFKAHRALVKPRDPALASLFLDRASEADANGVPGEQFAPRPTLNVLTRVVDMVADQLTALPRRVGGAVVQVFDREAVLTHLSNLAGVLESIATLISTPAPETPINGPLGEARSLGWVRLSLDVVRGIAEVLGGSVDDAILTMIADALGRYLRAR